MPEMSETQMRREVATRLLVEAGTLLEFWTEKTEDTDAEGIPHEFAQKCIARWLMKLPGQAWDTRLGDYPTPGVINAEERP